MSEIPANQPLQPKTPHHKPTDCANLAADAGGLPIFLSPQNPVQTAAKVLVVPGYAVKRLIAEGGMGQIWAGYELALDREVAIKTLKPGASAHRFVTEAKVTARLPHPNIPPVYALGQLEDGTPWLAMKLVRGHNLDALLRMTLRLPSAIPQIVQILEQVALAVGFAHSHGIIHRDIKPHNIMVGEFGEVQLMDWGLAKDINQSTQPETNTLSAGLTDGTAKSMGLTEEGYVVGTPGFMAPEQARGEPLDARTDVFALGALLANMLTGKPAFVGATLSEILELTARAELTDVKRRLDQCEADPELVAVAKRCLSAIPEGRPANGREVAALIATYRANVEKRLRQAETREAEALIRAAEVSKRRRLRWLASTAVIVSLTFGLVVSLAFLQRAITAEEQAIANAKRALENEAIAINERDAKDQALQAETLALAERTKALESEQRARRAEQLARTKARAALNALTDTLVGNQLARDPVLSENSKAFLRMMIDQYQQLAQLSGDDAESLAIRSEGLSQIARMQHQLDEVDSAERMYRQAIKMYETLVADFPQQLDHQIDLSRCQHNLGLLLSEQGRFAPAEQAYRNSINLRKRVIEKLPNQPQLLSDLALSQNNLSILLTQTGRYDEADVHRVESLTIQKRLVEDYPTRIEFALRLGTFYNNLGSQLRDKHCYAEAEQSFVEAIKLYQQLNIKSNPLEISVRKELAVVHINITLVQRELGKHADAESSCQKSIDLLKQLVQEYPTISAFRYYLSGSYTNLALLREKLRDFPEAEKYHQEALKLQKQLVVEVPSNVNYRSQLADCYNNLGAIWNQTGQFREADRAFRDCLAIRRQLASEHPEKMSHLAELAKALENLSIVNRKLEQFAVADQTSREALGIRRQLAESHPDLLVYRLDLAYCLNQYGLLMIHKGQHDEAERMLREALAIRQALEKKSLNGTRLSSDLSVSYQNLGRLLADTNRPAEAEENWRKAVAIRERLVSEHPKHELFRSAIADLYVELGLIQHLRLNYAAAEKSFRRSLVHREQLVEQFPNVLIYRVYQGGTHCNLGNAYRDSQRFGESLTEYEKAVHVLDAAVKANPNHSTARLFLRNSLWGRATVHQHFKKFDAALADWDRAIELSMPQQKRELQLNRASCLVLAGETGKAVAEVNALAKLAGWSAAQRYRLACVVATAAEKDETRRDELAARAVELLRRAVDAGYRDVARFRNNPELNTLRQRSDFQQLLGELKDQQ